MGYEKRGIFDGFYDSMYMYLLFFILSMKFIFYFLFFILSMIFYSIYESFLFFILSMKFFFILSMMYDVCMILFFVRLCFIF